MGNNNTKPTLNIDTNIVNLQTLLMLKKMVFELSEENVQIPFVEQVDFLITYFPISFDIIICKLIYSSFYSQRKNPKVYFEFLKKIEIKEKEIHKNDSEIIKTFVKHLSRNCYREEWQYILEKMFEHNIITTEELEDKRNLYFAQYFPKELFQIKYYFNNAEEFFKNFDELSKNDWELHKKYVQGEHNPNEIATIIRNDDIEKLQEISSIPNFKFNQNIKKSLYESYSFVNYECSLINYAAFFKSIKCFKYLLLNEADVTNAGRYAVAGGNLEIIHLCEQNHATFQGAYETAIQFHRNDIFKYLYENKTNEINNISKLGEICIKYNNYEILLYLTNEGMKIDDSMINEAAKNNNFLLVKYFLEENCIPTNILPYAVNTGNIELVKFILEHKGFDINGKNEEGVTAISVAASYGYLEIFKLLFKEKGIDCSSKDNYGNTTLIFACLSIIFSNNESCTIKIIKLLLKQKDIDINAQNFTGDTALIYAVSSDNINIVKLLLEHKGIDLNIKNNEGRVAIMFAHNNLEVVKLLVKHKGIDLNITDKHGFTVFTFFEEIAEPNVIEFLHDYLHIK